MRSNWASQEKSSREKRVARMAGKAHSIFPRLFNRRGNSYRRMQLRSEFLLSLKFTLIYTPTLITREFYALPSDRSQFFFLFSFFLSVIVRRSVQSCRSICNYSKLRISFFFFILLFLFFEHINEFNEVYFQGIFRFTQNWFVRVKLWCCE